jgi:prefoldin subunit 5|eukprot:CAMPEP_0169371880 /NCGR_PEP_ID=MMETSP1017-20121227/36144_1 /TAXON_ID=342587 /ORGANISM="Karlodinium micrum, Strain CCMP2283" /LENGTH=315 /DNA_ID=CAMNT_0009470429 /DNA_START=57 /DNA_END=1004 /DNA_ORIENTATION=-
MTAVACSEEDALFKTTENKRGIPEAIFIENVEARCKRAGASVILTQLQELYSKYQYMQSSLVAQRSALKAKLPDISSALDTVNHLIDRRSKAQEGETAEYTYQLSENIWSRASVAPTSNVSLWLGANVMLEYSLDEAVELLRTNEQNAKTTISTLDEDMAFLRDQITTTEVNIARTHNYNVKLRQKSKEAEDTQKALPSSSAPPTSAAPSSKAAPSKEITSGITSPDGSYSWKQEGEEVEISVSVPAGAAKSDIKVTILADSLRVEHSGKVLVEGELGGRCSPNGSTWTMNSGRVEVTLEKADSTRWPSLFVEEV